MESTAAVSESIPVITEAETEFLYLDLNTASVEEFMKLKGIGEITAQKIVDYRNAFGPFYSTYEIMNVSGIGEGTYSAIEPHIYVTYEKMDEEETEDVREAEEVCCSGNYTGLKTLCLRQWKILLNRQRKHRKL